MNRKEKIQMLRGIASGIIKTTEVKHYFVKPIGMLFEVSSGKYENANGEKFTDRDLKIYEDAKNITGMIISKA